MECLTWQCRGTPVGEEKMSMYSSRKFSICCYHTGEPCLEVVATIFFLPRGWIVMKKKFLVWEIILLYCFAVLKEMVEGGTTFGILYNLFPKVIIKQLGLDSYTTCRFYKYGWPNNTSATSRGATSHNTSSVNGLMLYGRRHCWRMQISLHQWSHPMVYGCRCAMVGRLSYFATSAEMRFFWLPLSKRNCNGEPFTHILAWKRCSPSSGSSGSSL